MTSLTIEKVLNYRDVNFKDENTHFTITPSENPIRGLYAEGEQYLFYIFSKDMAILEYYKKLLQQQKFDFPGGFEYKNFDSRGSFTVDAIGTFVVGDTVSTDAGGSTGEIYRIVDSTIYLKDIVGSFDNTDVLTDGGVKTANLTSDTTEIIYPYRIDIYPEELDDSWVKLIIEGWWIL